MLWQKFYKLKVLVGYGMVPRMYFCLIFVLSLDVLPHRYRSIRVVRFHQVITVAFFPLSLHSVFLSSMNFIISRKWNLWLSAQEGAISVTDRAGVKYVFVFANTNTNTNTAYLYLYLYLIKFQTMYLYLYLIHRIWCIWQIRFQIHFFSWAVF